MGQVLSESVLPFSALLAADNTTRETSPIVADIPSPADWTGELWVRSTAVTSSH